ncbi:hypothetical protein D9619_000773 [Psilocybe cf. subviscida]|uniref:Uncharacterized protein n=1 Tax=Psilocybe cf. subviscida TaxID=2480587 RepID=A0A8H5F2F1_9AGAR|nr:hypothetical protein D9619_000773 [Psilocybe cf. subviscida]
MKASLIPYSATSSSPQSSSRFENNPTEAKYASAWTANRADKNSRNKKAYYWVLSKSAGASKLELPEKYKDIFRNKPISVVEYHNLTPAEEREIFQRVQLGMSLTAAAHIHRWIAFLEKTHVAIENGLAENIKWNIKRGRDFQNIAHMVYCCDGLEPDGEHLLPTAQKLEKWISREDPPPHGFKKNIENVLKSLWVLSSDNRYDEAFTKVNAVVAPIEFVFLGVLLYVLRDEDRHIQARAAYTMRLTIRNEYRDIRNNTVLCRSLWKVVDALGRNPTAKNLLLDFEVDNQSAPKPKRKRASALEDDEFRPSPVRGLKNGARGTRAKKARS